MKVSLIIILLLILIVLLLFIDFKLGKRRHHSKVRQTIFRNRQGHITLFTSGTDLFERMFHDISKAKHHVHIIFYIVKNDEISQRFLKLLKKKASEGVEVRLLLDWVGSLGLDKATKDDLKKNGVKFSFSHIPKFPYLFYSSQERNHRKITVIDGLIGYLGGFNVAKEYIDQDPKLSPWRDYHMRITGEAVSDLQEIYFVDWKEATGEHVQYKEYFLKPDMKGNQQLRFVPTDGAFLEDEYLSLIKSARNSIIIGTPYFIPSSKIQNELVKALNRGISLQIIVPAISDHILVQEASYTYFRELLSLGAYVHQFQNGFFHAKYILIDDVLLDIGTANFDQRSLYLNHEMNCYILDSVSIQTFKKEILDDISNSTALTLEKLQEPNPWRSTKEKLAGIISTFL